MSSPKLFPLCFRVWGIKAPFSLVLGPATSLSNNKVHPISRNTRLWSVSPLKHRRADPVCLIPHRVRGAWDSGRCTGGAPQIYHEPMKRALQDLTDRKGLPRWPNGPVISSPTHPHCSWPWGRIFAPGLQELPLSLSSSLQDLWPVSED